MTSSRASLTKSFTAAATAVAAALMFASSIAVAHAGHEKAGSAPDGPFEVTAKEKVWLECASSAKDAGNTKAKFETPFERLTLHQQSGHKLDYAILLGKEAKAVKVGDVLQHPKLVIEKCDHPYQIRCDGRGQPVMLQYRGSQKDVYCAGRFNFVIEYDRDFESASPSNSSSHDPHG